MKTRSKFENWIYKEAGGPAAFAKKLGVHRSTVGHWVTGHNSPTGRMALLIVKMAKGKLALSDIINEGLLQ